MARSRYSYVLLRFFTYAQQIVGDLTPAEISRHAGVRKVVIEKLLSGHRINNSDFEKLAAYHDLTGADFDRKESGYGAPRGKVAA